MSHSAIWSYPLIRLTPVVIIGIAIYPHILLNTNALSMIAFAIIAIGILLNYRIKKSLYRYFAPDLLIYSLCLIMGFSLAFFHDPMQKGDHYLNLVSTSEHVHHLELQIKEKLRSNHFQERFIAQISAFNGQACRGKILLSIQKDSVPSLLKVDNILHITTGLRPINKAQNPHQFDYREFMSHRGVYHHINVKKAEVFISGQSKSLLGSVSRLRHRIMENLEQYEIGPDEKSVIMALLLGQRQEISSDLYDRYSQAGAIHILAISGLHIGIILMMLQFLFKPLDMLPGGSLIKIISILIILWTYAMIAGLSASVVRAVTMFSLFTISLNWKRKTSTYNTLAISIFLILLINPATIYELGFQMSYLAVLAILMFNPLFLKLWQPKWIAIRYTWQILTVTISAQIGVLPISLYYFHQFPGLFFITNLVLIPCLGIVLGLGFLVMILSLFNGLHETVVQGYSMVISLINKFVSVISGYEALVFKNISFDREQMLFSYTLIIMAYCFFTYWKSKYIIQLLTVVLLFQGGKILAHRDSRDNAFVIFHKSRHSLLGLKSQDELVVMASSEEINLEDPRIIDFQIGEKIKSIKKESLMNYYELPFSNLLIIDSTAAYDPSSAFARTIMLRDSPKINLNRLIDSLKPELVIWDGSNYLSYQKRWAQTCRAKKIPFHPTGEKGAYIIRF
ncbi:MAG: ComEC family competence protein [Flavobacteriaceae bacterium]|nr:ComEC family competence protein [Flavobacteriaceae bacterium]